MTNHRVISLRCRTIHVLLAGLVAASVLFLVGVTFPHLFDTPRVEMLAWMDSERNGTAKSHQLVHMNTAKKFANLTQTEIERNGTAKSRHELVHMNTAKKFAYLTQTESCLPSYWLSRSLLGNEVICDVYVLSYRKNCTEHTQLRHVFYTFNASWTPNTTWASGRNWLYEEANRRNYSYFILFDDDVLLLNEALGTRDVYPREEKLKQLAAEERNSSTLMLRQYETFLLRYKPEISSPNLCAGLHYCSRVYQRQVWPNMCGKKSGTAKLPGIMYTRHFDAAFNAFRSDAAADLLPYDTSLEKHSWYESQLSMIVDIAAHKRLMVAYFNMSIVNPVHRPYPRSLLRNIKTVFDLLPPGEKQNFALDELGYLQNGDSNGFLHNSAILCQEVKPEA